MKKIIFFFVCSFIIEQSFSQSSIEVYPSSWWVGMKMNKIQLMVHGQNIAKSFSVAQIAYPGVKVLKSAKVSNPNYLFIDIEIQKNAKPGNFNIDLSGVGNWSEKIGFELKPRRTGNGIAFAQGVTSKDLVYLLMPDRSVMVIR
jgi:hypothetical protein